MGTPRNISARLHKFAGAVLQEDTGYAYPTRRNNLETGQMLLGDRRNALLTTKQ